MPCASLRAVLIPAVMLSAILGDVQAAPQATADPETEKPKPILNYISGGWDTLTRSMTICSTVVDTKLAAVSVLYVPADFKVPDALREMEKSCGLEIRELPQVIQKPAAS